MAKQPEGILSYIPPVLVREKICAIRLIGD